MTTKATCIVSYLSIIGWLIAWLAGDRENAKFHLNQGLVLGIAQLITSLVLSKVLLCIPIIGWILYWAICIFLFVCFLIGLIGACQDQEKEMPLLGSIKMLK